MTDEQNNETSEQPEGSQEPEAAEETSTEAPDVEATGPVEESDSSSSPEAASEEPDSSPPADEAPEAQDEAPEAPEESSEEPVAEQDEAADADAEGEADGASDEVAEEEPVEAPVAEQPSTDKKKDVIPGADLEPIAVESEGAPLSAEERARREAEEEEERARREAELGGDSAEEDSGAARAPAQMDGDARFLATGKRKTSIARVTVMAGSGKVEINKRALEEFFPRPLHQTIALQALTTAGYRDSVDIRIRVHGGGISGQAGAIRHGIARALIEIDPELRGELKRRGFLTRDARVKERRKAGLKKARKRPQFSKR
jgi:small subunit ribosomal protein S9